MEHLPTELIGNIISRLGPARDVVIASTTCKKWRHAFCSHLPTLSFSSNDWPSDHGTSQFEILVSRTLLQTTGLQDLSISMDEIAEFSASVVISWLTGVDPNNQGMSCLKSLSLKCVSISALDLSLLLTACPKIEILDLVNLEMAMSDTQDKVELRSPTLKSICVKQISLDEFILEADSLERLHLKDCDLNLIKLAGKGTLKQLVIHSVASNNVLTPDPHFDISDNLLENLEVVDIYDFTIIWPLFYKMISRSSKLRRLRLWDVFVDDKNEIVDLETFSVCFPQLSHLSFCFIFLRDRVHYASPGSSHLENVIEMELGWNTINKHFGKWVEGLVKRCPNLRKLVIHGQDASPKEKGHCMRITSFIKHFMDEKYEHVEVQFV